MAVTTGVSGTSGGGGGGGSVDPAAPNAVELSDGAAYYVAAKDTTLQGVLTTSDFDTKAGSLTETAPATDTASSGLNGRLQRVAQRLTSLIALLPAALTGSGNLKVSVQESNAPQAVTAAALPLPTGAATDTTVAGVTTAVNTLTTQSDFDTKAGSLTETAPATDTASSGLNGRLQRVAQRLTSLIGLLPGALVSGRLDVNLGAAPAAVVLGAGSASIGNVGVTKVAGTISTVNSSAATLLANAVFTGTSEDVSGYASIVVSVFTDQAGTFSPQFSSNGTNWDFQGSHAITASTGAIFVFRPGTQFFRLVYTNGGVNQGLMRLQTDYHLDEVQYATAMSLGSGLPNPTTIMVGADLLVQTGGGTTWAPAKADGSNRITVSSDDGSLSTMGTTTDAGITTDIAGTEIGFLRGAIKQWVTYLSRFPAALGQTTAANSLPVTLATDGQFVTTNGSLTETAPATDTASSGLNGRLQRVAQRLTSLIALFPSALVSGRLDVNLGAAPATVAAQGDTAHGSSDAGNPLKTGGVAIAHGTNPSAVAAAQRTNLYANRAGVPFFIGGHPNIVTVRSNFTAAQTDTALVTVAAGTKIVVTSFMVTLDNAATVSVQARLGFGTANTPTTTGVIGSHPGIAAGSGFGRGGGSGILGVGADDEDLRLTCGVPTGGSLDVVTSYYTVPS